MTHKVKIHRVDRGQDEDMELSLESARSLVQQAIDSGSIVVDKGTLNIIHEVNQNIKEILILKPIAGG